MRRGLTLAALLALSAGATAIWASPKPRISANVQTTAQDTLTAEESLALSHTAARILGQTNRAWDALEAGDTETARKQVSKAVTLTKIADAVRPAYRVTDHIEAGDLSYDDEQIVPQKYIDISDDLEEVTVLGPAKEARDSLATDADAALGHVELEISTAKLDLPLAERRLEEARIALENDQPDAAKEALSSIQADAVVFEVATADLPLNTAEANLRVARERADNDDAEGARVALKAAAAALHRYQDMPASIHADEAAQVESEIERLAANMSTSGEARGSIDGWWDAVKAWLD